MESAQILALERVLLRLASVEEEQLGSILNELLPKLLEMLQPNLSPPVQAKLLECLSHINKRVRNRSQIPLPTMKMLKMLQTSNPFC